MADSVIVGGRECTIIEVHSVLTSGTDCPPLLHEKWSDVARGLKMPSEKIKQIRDDRLLNKITLCDAIHDILEEWVGRSGSAATLLVLVDALKIAKLEACAAALYKKFLIDPSNAIRKYRRLPVGLQEFLDDGKSKICMIKTLDSKITCDKIRENLKMNCTFHEWTDFLKLLSSSNGCSKTMMHIVENCSPITVNKTLSNLQDGENFGKIVFVIPGSNNDIERADGPESQNSPHEIRHVFDPLEWDDLTPNFQNELLESLDDSLRFLKDENKYPLNDILCGQPLVDLITGKTPKLFRDTIPTQKLYYINRTVTARNIISDKVFVESSPDIFLFIGIQRYELSELVQNEITDHSSNQIRHAEITVRFIVLDQPHHFEKICEMANHPVHIVKRELDGRLRWNQSKGKMDTIQKHVINEGEDLTEDMFMQQLPVNSPQPICISDTPGMGKSALLVQIGNWLLKNSHGKTVFFMVINEFIKQIKEMGSLKDLKMDIENVLLYMTCDNELGKAVLKRKLTSSKPEAEGSVNIELLFDGFDEVHASDLKLAHDVLRTIMTTFKCIRLWVTSRPHLQEELETTLSVLGHNIMPFQEADQIHFLSSYWSGKRNLNLERLKLFAKDCLRMLKSNMGSQDHEIAGIPLQCLLLAKVYKPEAREYAQFDNQPNVEGHHIQINSITSLYERLIDKKFKKYKTVYGGAINDSKLMNIFAWLSLELVFPHLIHTVTTHNFIQPTPEQIREILKVGITVAASNSSSSTTGTRFVHRTFAEYFSAWFILDKLDGSNNNDVELTSCSSLLETMLACDTLPVHLKHWTKTRTSSHKFRHPVICYFLNSLLSSKSKIFPVQFISKEALPQLAHACANANFLQLFNACNATPQFDEHGKTTFDQDFLLFTISFSSLEFVRIAFNHFEQYHQLHLELQTKALRRSVQRGNFSIVEFLLNEKQLRGIVEVTKGLVHLCVEFTKSNSTEQIDQRIQILRLLTGIKPSMATVRWNGVTPILSKDVHVRLMLEIILKFGVSVLLAQDESNDTILHLRYGRDLTAEEYNTLLTSIPFEMLGNINIVSVKGMHGHTPLMRLVEQIDPYPATLDLFKRLGEDFNCVYVDHEGSTILEVAVAQGRNGTTLRKLIECGAKIKWRKWYWRKNLLHYAAECGNPEAVGVLVESMRMDVNARDIAWNTPLDYAIFSERQRHAKRFEAGMELKRMGGTFKNGPNANGRTRLHQAVVNGNLDSIRLLVLLGVDVNRRDKQGNSPLHLWVMRLQFRNGLKLIGGARDRNRTISSISAGLESRKYNPSLPVSTGIVLPVFSSRTNNGTPSRHYFDHGAFLMASGADPNTPNKNGETPISVTMKWTESTEKDDVLAVLRK